MPFLDELSRKLRAQIPEFLGGYPQTGGYAPGSAQSRLSHGPVQAIPDNQWQQFQAQHGIGNTYGFSQGPSANNMTVYAPQHQFLNQSGPGAGTPRHEAIHQFLGPAEDKLDYNKVAALIGPQGIAQFRSKYPVYNSNADTMSEIPARLATGGADAFGMSQGSGQDAMRKYIELLRQTDSSRATRLSKYLGLSGSEKGDGVAGLQRPNDTF